MVMTLCGWENNHIVALATCHWLTSLSTYGIKA